MAVEGVEQRVQTQRFAALAQESAAGGGARRVPREMFGAKRSKAASSTDILRLATAT